MTTYLRDTTLGKPRIIAYLFMGYPVARHALAILHKPEGSLQSIRHIYLLEEVVEVRLDRVVANKELFGNLRVIQP